MHFWLCRKFSKIPEVFLQKYIVKTNLRNLDCPTVSCNTYTMVRPAAARADHPAPASRPGRQEDALVSGGSIGNAASSAGGLAGPSGLRAPAAGVPAGSLVVDGVAHAYTFGDDNRRPDCPPEVYNGLVDWIHGFLHLPLESTAPGFRMAGQRRQVEIRRERIT